MTGVRPRSRSVALAVVLVAALLAPAVAPVPAPAQAPRLDLSSLEPFAVAQGDVPAFVTLQGTGFVNGLRLEFGPGVVLRTQTLVSATRLDVVLEIAPDAPVGLRDVTVRAPAPDTTAATCTRCLVVQAALPGFAPADDPILSLPPVPDDEPVAADGDLGEEPSGTTLQVSAPGLLRRPRTPAGLARTGLALRVRTEGAARVAVELVAPPRAARRLGLGVDGELVLARRDAETREGRALTLALRPGARSQRLLRRHGRTPLALLVRVTAVAEDGERRVAVRRLALVGRR